MKYQFCIRFSKIDANSAASKAVLDCNKLFATAGYKDFTLTVNNNNNRAWYYCILLKNLLQFFFTIKKGSVVGVQYPLLSINHVFKYFIKLARLKNVTFFCIIHDLNSLRTGGKDAVAILQEINNLSFYNCVIAHNDRMIEWLEKNGLRTKIISLEVFDYLSPDFYPVKKMYTEKTIAYAGNLIKSKFVYDLPRIKNWQFNIYGPNFIPGRIANGSNLQWKGEFSPDEIAERLHGNFGLIWDGEHIDTCDEVLGNYMRYNNPHKFSLYIAAGLPVIAPQSAAIGNMITRLNIGVLVNNLEDLDQINIDKDTYTIMQHNILKLRQKIISGTFFSDAVLSAETIVEADNYSSPMLLKAEKA